jgi:hypothetical protein
MKLTLKQYQEVQKICKENSDVTIANGLTISYLFGLSIEQVNQISAKQYFRYLGKISVSKPLFNFTDRFETDIKNITFGQWLEVTEWLKHDIDTVIDKVAASILYDRTSHPLDCQRVQKFNAGIVIEAVSKFIESYAKLLNEYEWLFKSDEDFEGETEAERLRRLRKTHPFLKQWGWIFSAKEVAQHNGIKLDEAYNLPIIKALNDMCYLKSLSKYNEWQSKSV